MIGAGCVVKKRTANSSNLPDEPAQNSAADYQNVTDFSTQITWILGYFNRSRMINPPHNEWFVSNYDKYSVNSNLLPALKELMTEEVTIKIVMGSWCPDSRRELPRFLRIMDALSFPDERISYIGVDNAKLSPVAEYQSLSIERVPTFIFYKNKIEAGRIIENPVASLEQDMIDILTK